MTRFRSRFWPVLGIVSLVLALATPGAAQQVRSTSQSDTTEDAGLSREGPGLVSAFFGVQALPVVSNIICRGSRGKSGMPVIFPTEIDPDTMDAGDFRVTTRSGAVGHVHCVSLLPATDVGEWRTVLVIGDYGTADRDPPARVEIVGHIHALDGTRDYKGASAGVVPLPDGPSLAFAQGVEDWSLEGGLGPRRTRGTRCPREGIAQAVRVTWQGGVTLAYGSEPGDAERDLYRVTVVAADGTERVVQPAVLGDLGDGDNNHMLCLDTPDRVVSVAFPAGVLTDPNDDLNPATSVPVTPLP